MLPYFSCTRDERKERIVAECNSVRQALQELLSEYLSNQGKRPSEQLDAAITQMCRKTRDLRRQLRKAVVDHVSDSFLEADGPLLMLIAAAQEGKEADVEEFAAMFTDHANKLVEVAGLSFDGLKSLRTLKMKRNRVRKKSHELKILSIQFTFMRVRNSKNLLYFFCIYS